MTEFLPYKSHGAEPLFAVASEWPHLSRMGPLLEAPPTGVKHPSLTARYSFVSDRPFGSRGEILARSDRARESIGAF